MIPQLELGMDCLIHIPINALGDDKHNYIGDTYSYMELYIDKSIIPLGAMYAFEYRKRYLPQPF